MQWFSLMSPNITFNQNVKLVVMGKCEISNFHITDTREVKTKTRTSTRLGAQCSDHSVAGNGSTTYHCWKLLFSTQNIHCNPRILSYCHILPLSNQLTLTYFSPVPHFYTPWKRQKTFGFVTFSGGIRMWHWTKMG